MKNSKQLKEKLSKKYGAHVSLITNSIETEEISISALPYVDNTDISFIKKAIKGHFVNWSVKTSGSSCYIKIISDDE